MHALLRCLSAVALAVTLAIAGAAGVGVIRCTMPDGRQGVEGVTSALRCRAELTQTADAPAVPAIGGVCRDELFAMAQGDLVPEREVRWAALAVPSIRPFAQRPAPRWWFARHPSDPCRGRSAAIHRCVVLQI